MGRTDISDEEFCLKLPEIDSQLVLEIRNAIAEFFQAPATKIHPEDSLKDDLSRAAFDPSFHSFVVHRILADRQIAIKAFRFTTRKTDRINEFAQEVQRVLQSLK